MLRGTPAAVSVLTILLALPSVSSTITCHQTEYRNKEECCPMCPAGEYVKTDCTEYRSTTCRLCPRGTFTVGPNGLKSCNTCSVCVPASGLRTKRLCSRSSDAVCEALEGFFCLDSICSSAQKHANCKPGQYINTEGTPFADAECSDCGGGTFSDGSSTSCRPHTQCGTSRLIEAGNATTDARCGQSGWTRVAFAVTIPVLVIICIITGIIAGDRGNRRRWYKRENEA